MLVPRAFGRRVAAIGQEGPAFAKLARLSSIGLEMAVATFIGWLFGNWLDGKLGTRPWLMILFLLLGVTAGFLGLVRAAREASRGNGESKS